MAATIEDASIRDLEKLYEIEVECFEKEAFTKKQITQLLTEYNSISLMMKAGSQTVGFIIGTIYVERNALKGHIVTLDVLPAHRRQGFGQRLLNEVERMFMEKGAEICYLEVREGNEAALNLYLKLGYEKIGKLRNYYGDAHGICLKKTLR